MDADHQTVTIRSVQAGRAAEWIRQSWGLFKRNPGSWIGIILVWGIFSLIVGILPFGDVITDFALPVITGVLMLACRRTEQGAPLESGVLSEGFRLPAISSLLLLGAVAAAGGAITDVLIDGSPVADPLSLLSTGGGLDIGMPTTGVAALLGDLIAVLLLLALTTALWFAPALVVFRQLKPVAAIKASLEGIRRNVWPLTVYSLLGLILLVAGTISFLIGLLVVFPVLLISIYYTYQDIYG